MGRFNNCYITISQLNLAAHKSHPLKVCPLQLCLYFRRRVLSTIAHVAKSAAGLSAPSEWRGGKLSSSSILDEAGNTDPPLPDLPAINSTDDIDMAWDFDALPRTPYGWQVRDLTCRLSIQP